MNQGADGKTVVRHTPGPWRLAERKDGSLVQRGNEGGFFVQGRTPSRVIADARLIAAAPDLLAFAESIITLFEVAYPKARLHLDMDKSGLLNAAKEVVKKATAAP